MYPRAGFYPKPATEALLSALLALPASDMCDALGISLETHLGYLTGQIPTPKIVFLFAQVIAGQELGKGWGKFSGMRIEGDWLVLPGYDKKEGIRYEELKNLWHTRQTLALASGYTRTIEKLMLERDFYKRQCRKEARFGMMLNQIIP
ncbi:hypothetical protein [Janthinobacterium sp. B9-8]|uniref:hypothetical protein n=1 Tax=Janthinobacterium sp. B9-8 TaxID=1236179 RepID=UPI00061CFAFF|nr:hypothetical protein [Janthinobacterium sp. B9-8]AMC34246.1 hypothetical protein VN23_06365 [Janthinobacterium sp. B9-8]